MTIIAEFLNKNFMEAKKIRLAKLEALDAPAVIIETLKKEIASGDVTSKVGKIKDFGGLEFVNVSNKKYRRGNGPVFILENGSKIYGIPGPHGFFLTSHEGK